MKDNISQQDLTDYALNELGPNERLYVESMLAISEEHRNDISKNIDLALMLEEGFEQDEEKIPALLTDAQREKVLEFHAPSRFFQRATAFLSAAAAIALALITHDAWLPKGSASQMARVSGYVADAVSSSEDDDFATRLANFRRLAEDPGFKKWFSAQSVTSPQGVTATQSALWTGGARSSLDLR